MLTLLKRPRTPDSRHPQVAHRPPCSSAETDAIRKSRPGRRRKSAGVRRGTADAGEMRVERGCLSGELGAAGARLLDVAGAHRRDSEKAITGCEQNVAPSHRGTQKFALVGAEFSRAYNLDKVIH